MTPFSLTWGQLLSMLGLFLLLILSAAIAGQPNWKQFFSGTSSDFGKKDEQTTTSGPIPEGGEVLVDESKFDANDLAEALDMLVRCYEYLDLHDLNNELRTEIAEFIGLDQHR